MSGITAVPLRPVKKGSITRLWIGIALAVAAAGGLAWAGTSAPVATAGTNEQFLAWHAGQSGVVTTPSGLQYVVQAKGEGATPTDADLALINYKGTLRDGTVFDQNERTPLPVSGVVPGFSEALKLMPRGAKYRVWIPSALGYGEAAPGGVIPANSVLIFDIEMIDFRNQAEVQAMQQMQQMQGGMPEGPPPGR